MKKLKTIVKKDIELTDEQKKFKKEFEQFKLAELSKKDIIHYYTKYFGKPLPYIPIVMLSLKVEYMLWKNSLPEKKWHELGSRVHDNYIAAMRLRANELTGTIRDLIDTYIELEQKEKKEQKEEKMTKVKTIVKKKVTTTVAEKKETQQQTAPTSVKSIKDIGLMTKVGVKESWVMYLGKNNMTDEQITEAMKQNFPNPVKKILYDNVAWQRRRYNKGEFTGGNVPEVQSFKVLPRLQK